MINLLSIILGLLVLSILVFIHELGHFIAAKVNGIRVISFSIGFGKPIWKIKGKETEYLISSIPFGGYVKMAGENIEERKGNSDEFYSKSIPQRISVALAGPLFNYIAAILMLWIVFIVGIERPVYLEKTVVGAVEKNTPAFNAGFMTGDSIVTVNGKSIGDWIEIEEMFSRMEKSYNIEIIRNGEKHSLLLKKPESDKKEVNWGLHPSLPAKVGALVDGSPAEKAGLKKGDEILYIDSTKINSWFGLLFFLKDYKSNIPLSFHIRREAKDTIVFITPKLDSASNRYVIGIHVSEGEKKMIRFSPTVAFTKATSKGWEYTTLIFDVIKKLMSREVGVDQLSGPVGIIPASGFILLQGVSPILNFMALIGINLAILNLLPLVITDGGLIFFFLIEAIRRKPLSLRTQSILNRIAIAFFITLFIFITFNDIRRLPEFFKIFGK